MKIPTGSADEAREFLRCLDVQVCQARERADKRRARLESMIRDVWNDLERETAPMRRQREAIVRTLIDLSNPTAPAPVIIKKEEA